MTPIWRVLLLNKSSNSPDELLGSLFDSNGNGHGHTNHGVVTCADETHHFFAVDALGELQSGETF